MLANIHFPIGDNTERKQTTYLQTKADGNNGSLCWMRHSFL